MKNSQKLLFVGGWLSRHLSVIPRHNLTTCELFISFYFQVKYPINYTAGLTPARHSFDAVFLLIKDLIGKGTNSH